MLISFKAHDPLSKAISFMLDRVRHVIIQLPPPFYAQRLLSRTDVIRWLCSNASCFPSLDASLTQLGLCTPARALVSMTTHESAFMGLRRLIEQNLGALPVIDQTTGTVVATFSCSVVRYLSMDKLSDVTDLPVLEFLRKYHPPSLQPLLCEANDRLIAVIQRILSKGVHRAWIVDASHRPIACVSLADVLRVVPPSSSINIPPSSLSGASLCSKPSTMVMLS